MREVIRQKIVDSLASPVPAFTRRDVRLPDVPRKAVAVIGMRRTGKTTFLWQVLADHLTQGTGREGLLYFNWRFEAFCLLRTEADRRIGRFRATHKKVAATPGKSKGIHRHLRGRTLRDRNLRRKSR